MKIPAMEQTGIQDWRSAGRAIGLPLALMAAAPLNGGWQGVPLLFSGFPNFDPHVAVSSVSLKPIHVLREIRDPHTGICWRLLSNLAAPAGPAQLAASGAGDSCPPVQAGQAAQRFAIQQGDRVVLEEHTPTVDARLEAVAMGSAMTGSFLDLRLKIGGKVVRAVAIAPGRAILRPPREENQ
jgi:hypothetical protein